jgi:hypothetical protein
MELSSKAAVRETAWSLEVVRGRQAGRVYKLGPGETMIGSGLDGQPGLDLKDQEGDSPRRMAGRQAAIVTTGKEVVIRDLDSPGGTFVNRQRLLAGQTRRLEPGDLIQVGSVQLAVKAVDAPAPPSPVQAAGPSPPAPAQRTAPPPLPSAAVTGPASPAQTSSARPLAGGRLAIPFTLSGGPTCRSWDDFLVLAAQEWRALCDELTSGRLGEYIRRAQRPDLLPRLDKSRPADDLLDEWLGRLPTTKPSAPELDVHPASLHVRAPGGGILTRQTVRVTNVGYRLLRSTVRVEPVTARWLRVSADAHGGPFTTVDETDLSVELELPETLDQPLEAAILIESNGGTRRVPVRVEKAQATIQPALSASNGPIGIEAVALGGTLLEKLGSVRPQVRVLFGAGAAIALRLLTVIMGAAVHGATGTRLSTVALALVVAGAAVASWMALRRGEQNDVPAAAFAGGSLGLLAAAVGFALIQTVERVLGTYAASVWAVGLLWGTIGGLVALASNYLIPYRPSTGEIAP